jgi:hypothetical protein
VAAWLAAGATPLSARPSGRVDSTNRERPRSDPSTAAIEAVAAALTNARIVVLAGQEHVADVLAPEIFADPPPVPCATKGPSATDR